MAEERRKSPRIVVDAPARLKVQAETQNGRVRDICRDAALVEANRWYPLETRVTIETELPRVPGTIRASGTIIRLAPGEQGMHGMAILFDDLPAEAAMRIELFISEQED